MIAKPARTALAEALLSGACGRRQLKFEKHHPHGDACCALGAIEISAGAIDDPSKRDAIWPELVHDAVCPVTGERRLLKAVIIDLNDNHGWTFERIARYIALLDAR